MEQEGKSPFAFSFPMEAAITVFLLCIASSYHVTWALHLQC